MSPHVENPDWHAMVNAFVRGVLRRVETVEPYSFVHEDFMACRDC